MKPRAPLVEFLVRVAQRADAAGWGKREAVYVQACAETGMSRSALLRALRGVCGRPQRKRRSDAGKVALTLDEMQLISALLMDSLSKAGKRRMTVEQAVDILRRNDEIRAERVDRQTGEVCPLSTSAIVRALRKHALHPDQLTRPSTAVELRSLHPNHVWQIDASVCVLFYLTESDGGESGVQVMPAEVFYKNKPQNFRRIEPQRVIRYVVTDHYSGAIYVHYVYGSESGENLAEAFVSAVQKRAQDNDPMHGVPLVLMMDAGCANTSGLFKNLMRRLMIEPIVHAPGNARADGSVESAQNIVERGFESTLRLRPVRNIGELNAAAWRWMRRFNGQNKHSRHGRARYDVWMTIAPEQLRVAPSREACRELLTHGPETRVVSDTLTVAFDGCEYDVSSVPRAMIGESLLVTMSPYRRDAALIVDTDAEGHELLHVAPLVERNEAGFRTDANVIGVDWKRPRETLADANRKLVERIATDTETDAAAKAVRKTKAPSFGGRLDPEKGYDEASAAKYLPRRGEALKPAARVHEATRTLTGFEAARALVRRGVQMTPERNRLVAQLYPDGVPESALDELQRRLVVASSLRVVGGAS